MTTNSTQHLWLLYSFKEPFVRPRPFRGQQSTRPHQNNFSLEIQGDVEQQEPGNTQTHTFVLPWPYAVSRLFFYSINQGTGSLKATRSPIFAYEISPQILLQETWSVTGQPDLPWSHPGTPPNPFPYNGGGTVTLHGSIDTADYIDLPVSLLLGNSPATLCNLFVRVTIGHFLEPPDVSEAEGQVAFLYANDLAQTSSRVAYFTTREDPCTYHPRNYVYPASVSATVGFPPSPMLLTLPNICNESNDPSIPNAYLETLRLFAAVAGPLDPPRNWSFTYGPVQIGTTNGLLTDVSGVWRSKRISPFLA